jgi:hypothetical protein
MNFKILISVFLGILFVIVAILYFVEPASSLPAFIPGHDTTLIHHYKHGLGTLILGIGCFVFAWFQSGKSSKKE